MKNSLADLNNHLFEMIERLNDDDLSKEDLEKEVQRTKAVTEVASQILEIGKLELDVIKIKGSYEYNVTDKHMPELLTDKSTR